MQFHKSIYYLAQDQIPKTIAVESESSLVSSFWIDSSNTTRRALYTSGVWRQNNGRSTVITARHIVKEKLACIQLLFARACYETRVACATRTVALTGRGKKKEKRCQAASRQNAVGATWHRYASHETTWRCPLPQKGGPRAITKGRTCTAQTHPPTSCIS